MSRIVQPLALSLRLFARSRTNDWVRGLKFPGRALGRKAGLSRFNYFLSIGLVTAGLGLVGCANPPVTPAGLAARPGVANVLDSIDGARISSHVEVLASDSFGGRRPGTQGEILTLDYITRALKSYGIQAAPGEDYRQAFPISAHDVSFSGSLGPVTLAHGENIAAAPWPHGDVNWADAPLVFGGYGLVSEEYGRNDYASIDLSGAVVVVLGGPPPGQDSLVTVANYGSKQTAIAERGAVGMIAVWQEDTFSWPDTRFYYASPFFYQSPAGSLPVLETSEMMLSQMLLPVNLSPQQARLDAADSSFRARPLPWRFSGQLVTQTRPMRSFNVVAQIPGSDPALSDEWIVLTAHWDHLGTDPALSGDQIYNGALDNATGVATLLEIARAAAQLPSPPRRGLRFVFTGAEEFGRLGAKAYVASLKDTDEQTIAVINLDFQNPFGRASDIVIIGDGNSTIEDVLSDVARWQGRVVSADPWEVEGFYRRSDHFDFAQAGIPVLFPASGVDLVDGGRERGLAVAQSMFEQELHDVSDEVSPDYDFEGIVEDAQAFLMLTLMLSEETKPPQWKETTAYPEFAARH